MNFAEKVIQFNQSLHFSNSLPPNIGIMNPFAENKEALALSSLFYRKFYSDSKPRKLILGINPGRLGAGVTGVPFTDTKRLKEKCGIDMTSVSTHEPSSVFVYDLIDAFGGVQEFYSNYYINSVCPLGFVISDKKGTKKNYNYYDSKELTSIMTSFIMSSLKKQISFGINIDTCYCLGTGKNYKFILSLNNQFELFNKIIVDIQ